MEDITSRIDTELVRSHERFIGKQDNDEIDGGAIVAGNHKIVIPQSDICTCKHVTIKSDASKYMKKFQRDYCFDSSNSSHSHDGSNTDCEICLSIKGCHDIPQIMYAGNIRKDYIIGGSKPNKKLKKIEDCTDDAIPTLNVEANKILSYIYNKYPETDNNQPITESMISDAMNKMKIGVLHTDLPRVFEIVLLKHKRGLGKKGEIQHPLHYVICHMKDLINPLISFEKSIEGYAYSELILNLKVQSANYDQSALEKIPLKFDVSTMIHPIIVALFWSQIPCVEQMCVESDQFQLLKNIHLTMDKIKPSSFNFDLTTSRWNEKNPIAFFGLTNVIDTEIKRVLCHVYLKKIIYKLRSGEINTIDSNKLISWTKRIFVFNSYDSSDEAEQLITAFLNLFLIRPIKLFVQDQMLLGPNCNFVINSSIDDYMKESPFLYCETISQMGGIPYTQMPEFLNCIRYDKIKGRAVLNLNYTSADRIPINMATCQPTVSCNGIIPIFTKRKAVLTYRDLTHSRLEEDVEYISTASLLLRPSYMLDGKTYDLTSILCYETIDPNITFGAMTDKKIAAGYFALVKSDTPSNDGLPSKRMWFKYSLTSFVGPQNIEVLKNNYIEKELNRLRDIDLNDLDNVVNNNKSDTDNYINPRKETISNRFYDRLANNLIDAQALMISQDEAMMLAETNCCLLMYCEDYNVYKDTLIRTRVM